MKSGLGSLLLIIGTVCGSLAAASNERAWRRLPLSEAPLADPSVVLFDDVEREVDPSSEEATAEEALQGGVAPDETVLDDLGAAPAAELVAAAGDMLSAEVVALLRTRGETAVRVRRMARTEEEIPVDDALAGRILARAVYTDEATGAVLTPEAAQGRVALVEAARAALADLPEGSAVYLQASEGGVWEAVPEPTGEEATQVTAPDLAPLDADARLAGLPPMRTLAPAGRFIDDELAAILIDGGLQTLSVRVPKPAFSLAAWPGLIPFVASVIAMAVGVLLLRSGRREQLTAAEAAGSGQDELSPGERLATIVAGVRAVAAESGRLDAPTIMARVDPLLTVDCVAFVEARDGLRLSLGGRAYAAVMGPFATGERRLSRAWSAAADGYVDEARASLAETAEPLEQALEALAGRTPRARDDEGLEHEHDAEVAEGAVSDGRTEIER